MLIAYYSEDEERLMFWIPLSQAEKIVPIYILNFLIFLI